MKLIDIPYSPVSLFIFYGENNRKAFDDKVRFQYSEWESEESADGMHYMNHVFVEDAKDISILIHEIHHFLEWLFEYMCIENESEFKACISSHVICEALK